MSVKSVQAIVNDVVIDLEQNTSTGMWETAAIAPAKSSYTLDGHYYGVTIIATDEAGNETTVDVTDTEFGEALKLIVKELVAPNIHIASPTEGEITSNTSPTIEFTVEDDDSGVDEDTITLLIDGLEVSGLTITEIEGGYSASYTVDNLEDGKHTVEVKASDHDGNEAESTEITFTINTEAPSLSIISPEDGEYFSSGEMEFSGTTDGTTITVQVGDNDPIEVEIIDGTFSGTVQLSEGENTITFIATSESGVTTIITRTVYADTAAPIIKNIVLAPNPVDCGSTYIITVEVVDE